MAVAETKRMEKDEVDRPGPPSWLAGAMGWGPKKFAELKSFFVEVRSELKKVTWPSRQEVYSTTLVVMATTVFFGFYLWGLDLAFSRILSQVLKR
jgi:preprotein translocase subunit SecE